MFSQLSTFLSACEMFFEHYLSHSSASFSIRWITDSQSSVALVNGDASLNLMKLLE
jgi:hypothetical protein